MRRSSISAVPAGFSTMVLALVIGLALPPASFANEEVYQKVAPSTAMIESGGLFDGGMGTGFLVDAEERLVVTAYHVVQRRNGVVDQVTLTFAQVKDGEVITDRKHYQQARSGVKGKVIYFSKKRDMAIIQVDKLPDGIKPLKLAEKPARPGQTIHVIGQGTEKFGGMFGYSQGYIRNVFVFDATGAKVVAHQAPTNPGDSGGPVVNSKGEVVGFISIGTTGVPPPNKLDPFYSVQVTDLSICVSEIHQGLKERREKPIDLAKTPDQKPDPKSDPNAKPLDVGPGGLVLRGTIQDNSPEYTLQIRPNDNVPLPGKMYLVRLSGGKEYRVTMDSRDLDSVLLVQDPDGKQIAWDDDSGGMLNSLLTLQIPRDGVYKIYALSLVGTGKYTLSVRETGKARDVQDNGKVEDKGKAIDKGENAEPRNVGDGLTFSGELGARTAVVYKVNLVAGKSYVIDMTAPDTKKLDPYLYLLDAAGKEIASDDDSGGNGNARISVAITDTGVYQIRATSFLNLGAGGFTVTVREQKK